MLASLVGALPQMTAASHRRHQSSQLPTGARMNRARFNAVAFAVSLALFSDDARAADAAVTAQLEAQSQAFTAAYEDGDVPKMKAAVKKAVALGEKNGLAADPAMVETYVLAAILEADGNENTAASVKYFVKALKLKPDLAIPKGMGTSTVKGALKQARAELGEAPKEVAAPPPAAAPAAKVETAKVEKKSEPEPAPAKDDKAEKEAQKQNEKALSEAKARAQQAEQQAQKDKSERDKQLADARARIQQLEQQLQQNKAASDKQLADSKARTQQLEQQLQQSKAASDKQLADSKARIQQLEQQLQQSKADRDRQLADAKAREDKEREAREKIEHERQVAEAKARDAENKKKQEQQNRERLFAGPELPARINEPLLCSVPDEAPLRTDLFVHCVARPNVKARSIVFYYRVAGSAQYYSMPMERTSKGWHAALVPGVRVVGKVMQYYAEALDAREAVVAHNGKESSPNILTLKPASRS
jgi:hypothetical protein